MFKKITKTFESLDNRLREVTHETPITVASLIALFFVASYAIFDPQYVFIESKLMACGLTLMFAVLLSYIVHKFLGQKNHLLSIAIVIVSALLYYIFIPKSSEIFYSDIWYTLLFLNWCLVLILLIAPFVRSFIAKKPEKNEIYFNYMMRVVVTTIQAVFVAGVLTLLTFAAFWALDSLFNLSLPGELFALAFALASIIVAPLFWLTEMKGVDTTKLLPRTFLKVIVLYIGIPFATIYMLILYAYSIRVLINISDWPEASISWLIIVFSVFGWFLFIASHPFRDHSLVALFRKYFPYVALPQTAMLFYAIYLRIAQYGWTIDRYLVVSFGIGILFFALYTIFSKSKHLIVYPLVFVVVILISITGPWGMNNVSEQSQLSELEMRLGTLDILVDGNIEPISETELQAAPRDELESAVSIIRYICSNHGCESMRNLLGDEAYVVPELNPPVFEREIYDITPIANQYTILQNLGLENIYYYTERDEDFESLSYYNHSQKRVFDVSGYSTFQIVESYINQQNGKRVVIEYVDRNDVSQKIDITDEFIEFLKEYGMPMRVPEREAYQDMIAPTLELDGASLYLQRASVGIESGEVERYDLSGYLFIK